MADQDLARPMHNLSRFSARPIGGDYQSLAPDNPAAMEGRTLFPSRVADSSVAKHYLMSGYHSEKTGKIVTKGRWAGMPIYTLTLEERRTCPRYCHQWHSCYGSAMPHPHRWDHTDPNFEEFLKAEVITKCREHPKGLVVRLHVLGDFYSVDYVKLWTDLVDRFPQLHIFGYTAYREDDPNEEGAKIAKALRWLSNAAYDQIAIRFTDDRPAPLGAMVVEAEVDDPDVIMCPQQTQKTATCGTCGLCWNESAMDKTIGFLRHGRKVRSGPHKRLKLGSRLSPVGEHGLTQIEDDALRILLSQAEDNGLIRNSSTRTLAKDLGVSPATSTRMIHALVKAQFLRVLVQGKNGTSSVMQIFAEPQDIWPDKPLIPAPAKRAKPLPAFSDPRPPARTAVVAKERKPDEPLVRKAKYVPQAYDSKGRLVRPWMIGSAAEFDIGTPEERIQALDEAEKARIAAQYGASFKPKKESQ